MGLNIYSSVKNITNAQYIYISNDRSWLSLRRNWSKDTMYYGRRSTHRFWENWLEPILASPYPIYETLYEQLDLSEPLNIRTVLRINNNPPSKQQKLRKWQQSAEMARTSLPSSTIRTISTCPDISPSRLIF